MPSWPAETPSVRTQPPSQIRSRWAPAGMMLESPLGDGKPGSTANALVVSARPASRTRAKTTTLRLSSSTIRMMLSLSVPQVDRHTTDGDRRLGGSYRGWDTSPGPDASQSASFPAGAPPGDSCGEGLDPDPAEGAPDAQGAGAP